MSQFVFLPGASGVLSFWQPVAEQLRVELGLAEQQVKIQSYPEFGGQPAHPEVHSFEDLQHHVLAQMNAPSIIIAQSMGGIFAVQAALQKPQYIQALVLVATSGGLDLSPFRVKDWRGEYQQNFSVPDWFVRHQSFMDEQLEKIQCPVLLIWGDKDSISPLAVGQYLQQKFRYAELYVVKDGQHDLAHVHAGEVASVIEHFIKKCK